MDQSNRVEPMSTALVHSVRYNTIIRPQPHLTTFQCALMLRSPVLTHSHQKGSGGMHVPGSDFHELKTLVKQFG